MKLIVALIFSTLILSVFEKQFRKRPYIMYLGGLTLGIIGLIFPTFLSEYINRGTLATSLFIIVMYARVLPVKSRFYKTFMSLRAPIAITASFLIFLHNGKTLYNYIKLYINFGVALKPYEIFAAVCSFIMFMLLIPLTITSFMPVRKKMKYTVWKKLQKTSYIFYGLIYFHVATLFAYQIYLGKNNYLFDLIVYTLIFGNYLFLRLALYYKKNSIKLYGLVSTAIVSLIIVFVSIYIIRPKGEKIIETEIALDVASEAPSQYKDGEYNAKAIGYNGDIELKVIISNGKITDIKIIDYQDDYEYFNSAWDVLPLEIIRAQSTDIDCVTGATYSSKGILKAVSNALDAAK